MIKPVTPENESKRLAALYEYQILDTIPEKDFDDLTKLAAEVCKTPVSLVSLIDTNRQWFKSNRGFEVNETERDVAFCAHAINEPEVLIVNDTRKDTRFHDNPLTRQDPKTIFYAGVPLINSGGYALGTLCVIDHQPKDIDENQLNALKILARQVLTQMELRKQVHLLQTKNIEIEQINYHLLEFSKRISHDLKAPIRGINTITKWMQNEYYKTLGEQGVEYLRHLETNAFQLDKILEAALEYSKTTFSNFQEFENINLTTFFKELIDHCKVPESFEVIYPVNNPIIKQFRQGMYQVFYHLFRNSVQFNDKKNGLIEISYSNSNLKHKFIYKDNGPGIEDSHKEKVFKLFETATEHGKRYGAGIGLTMVKAIIQKLGGTVSLADNPEQSSGVCFTLEIPIKH